MKNIYLSIIIPAYNEETNIRLGALDKVARFLDTRSYSWEVIVVDDGSNDNTVALLAESIGRNPHFRILKNPHQGKAATVIAGIRAATGDLVLFTDLDQATPLKESEKLLSWFDKGYDVVIGSRQSKREGAPFLRRIMARGFMTLRTVVLGLKGISDTQCGFKAFKREVAGRIISRLSIYGKQKTVRGAMVTAGFDIEVLFLAKMLGFKIKEVPVEWHYVETRRVNPVSDTLQGFSDIMRIRIKEWKGVYSSGDHS